MAQRLESVAHPLFPVHLMREDVVNMVSRRYFPQALAASADRMLRQLDLSELLPLLAVVKPVK